MEHRTASTNVPAPRSGRRFRSSVVPTIPGGARPEPGARRPRPAGAGVGARRAQGARGAGGQAEARISSACPVAKATGLEPARVHRGVDFLKVSMWVDWDDKGKRFLEYLDQRKKAMQATESVELSPVTLAGVPWNLARTGTRHFPYRLVAGDVVLLLSSRSSGGNTPSVRVEMGSLTSQTVLASTLNNVRAVLASIGADERREHIAEIHLAADFIGVSLQDINIQDMDRWITKGVNFGTYCEHRTLTGCTIGKGDLMLRVYDKVRELRQADHKQGVFADLWGVGRFDELPVTRVEFQLRRPVLKNFLESEERDAEGLAVLGNVEFLLRSIASVWSYCCHDWARFNETIVDRSNKHQSRAKLSAFWEAVQAVVWIDLFQVHRKKPETLKDIKKLRRQATGLLMSIAAFFCPDIYDLDDIIGTAKKIIDTDIKLFFEEDENEFIERMMVKRNHALLAI